MTAPKRVLVIYNPRADRGRSGSRITDLANALEEAGVPADFATTQSHGQAILLAAQGMGTGHSAIVAAGGDGTINEVINGLAMYAREAGQEDAPLGPLAIYPIGGGNDLAHSLRLRPDARAVARAIGSPKPRYIDLGWATLRGSSHEVRRYFHNSLGFGLEASVTQQSDHIERLSGGPLYMAAAFRALRSYSAPRAAVEWTDEIGERHAMEQELTIISIGNARRTGGAFYLTPDAEVDDELFDVAMAGPMSRLRLLSLLPRALVGKHTGARSVRMLRCGRIFVRTQEPLPVHIDGEVIMADAVETEAVIRPAKLAILG